MMPNIRFPPEIFELFIDEVSALPAESKKTLLSCNLVSRSFSHRSRRHLFRYIHLKFHQAALLPRLSILEEILFPGNGLSGVAPYVEDLFLEAFPGDRAPPAFISDRVVQILNLLHGKEYGIKSLKFHFSLLGMLQWEHFNMEFRLALTRLIHSPHLKRLGLEGLKGLPAHFLDAPNLTDLTIGSLSVLPDSTEPSATITNVRSLPRLQRLNTDQTIEPFPLNTLSVSPYKGLVSLRINLRDISGLRKAERILRETDGSLESWELLAKAPIDLCGLGPLNFHQFSNLANFAVRPHLPARSGHALRSTYPAVEQACHLLNGQGTATALKYLHLTVGLDQAKLTELENPTSDSPWLTLDTILSGPRFPSLRTFYIACFIFIEDRISDLDPLEDIVRSLAPRALPLVSAKKRVISSPFLI